MYDPSDVPTLWNNLRGHLEQNPYKHKSSGHQLVVTFISLKL
jgi:hypothetical protein